MSFNKPVAGGAHFGNAFDLSTLKKPTADQLPTVGIAVTPAIAAGGTGNVPTVLRVSVGSAGCVGQACCGDSPDGDEVFHRSLSLR